MSDRIRIVDLEVRTRIGVPEEERAEPQRLLVTLVMEVAGIGPAAQSDDIALTFDYAKVAECIRLFAEARPRRLLETFAERLAEELFSSFPIQRLRLEVKKFVLIDAHYVSIEIERSRPAP